MNIYEIKTSGGAEIHLIEASSSIEALKIFKKGHKNIYVTHIRLVEKLPQKRSELMNRYYLFKITSSNQFIEINGKGYAEFFKFLCNRY